MKRKGAKWWPSVKERRWPDNSQHEAGVRHRAYVKCPDGQGKGGTDKSPVRGMSRRPGEWGARTVEAQQRCEGGFVRPPGFCQSPTGERGEERSGS